MAGEYNSGRESRSAPIHCHQQRWKEQKIRDECEEERDRDEQAKRPTGCEARAGERQETARQHRRPQCSTHAAKGGAHGVGSSTVLASGLQVLAQNVDDYRKLGRPRSRFASEAFRSGIRDNRCCTTSMRRGGERDAVPDYHGTDGVLVLDAPDDALIKRMNRVMDEIG